jgi:hypothetical protein
VNYDYANYSAHLFLANSYNDLRDPNEINLRYETPAESEFLVANLLAPVSAGPLSPAISQGEYDTVPKAVMQATCEMARELLIADRTTAPPGEGLKYQNVGGTQTGYDKTDRCQVLSQVAQVMLAKYGSQISAHSGTVRLQRV